MWEGVGVVWMGTGGGKGRFRGLEAVSQLGSESGTSLIVVPGSRSDGASSRCSRNKTWNKLNMHPEVGSQRRYALE